MDIAVAFKVLELSNGATLEDVSISFRRLLKIYHPDRNLDRTEWSHERTVELNEAYMAVTDYLRNGGDAVAVEEPFTEATDVYGSGVGPQHSDYTAHEDQYAGSAHEAPVDPAYSVTLQMRLATEYDLLLDQLFAFYSFGLENLHLRSEGSFRYRFRTVFKHLKSVVARFQELKQWPGSRIQRHQIATVHAFATAFYENLLIKPHTHQVLTGNEYRAYRLYRQGSETLDEAIRARLFGDQLGNKTSYPATLSTCERALMLVVAHYPKCQYTPETLIKLYLLETFNRLCDVLDAA